MKNKKGKSLIGLLLLLVAVGIFGYFGYSTMGAIKLGLDLAGGVSITYQAKEANPSSEDMADTIYKLQQRVQNYSTEAKFTRKAATVSTWISRALPTPIRSWRSWESQVPYSSWMRACRWS